MTHQEYIERRRKGIIKALMTPGQAWKGMKNIPIELIWALEKHDDQLVLDVIGKELEEGDGWDWAFGDEAKCCPGDDFAYYGNYIKKTQRQIVRGE